MYSHFDHLDPEAILELGDSCEWIVPIGVGPFIRQHGVTRVTELEWVFGFISKAWLTRVSDVSSWWQETKHTLKRPGQKDQTFTITAVPNMVRSIHILTEKLTSSTGRHVLHLTRTLLYGPHSTSNPILTNPAHSSTSVIPGKSSWISHRS